MFNIPPPYLWMEHSAPMYVKQLQLFGDGGIE